MSESTGPTDAHITTHINLRGEAANDDHTLAQHNAWALKTLQSILASVDPNRMRGLVFSVGELGDDGQLTMHNTFVGSDETTAYMLHNLQNQLDQAADWPETQLPEELLP